MLPVDWIPTTHYFITCLIAICKNYTVQNWAAKVILGGKIYDQVFPLLKEMHWLPVVKQVQFKVLLLCYCCLKGSAPRYLTSLLSPHKPPHNLRSSRDVLKLNVPCCKRLWGDRAFSVAAPHLWNHLQDEIRAAPSVNIFKSLLKAHLFSQ